MTIKKFNDDSVDSWTSWKVYVVKTLEKLEEKQASLEKNIHNDQMDHMALKTKIQITSGLTSFIIALISTLIINIIAGYSVHKFTKNNNIKEYNNTAVTMTLNKDKK